jgi:uncharacterized membrane protein (Fun14 family)
VVVGVVVVSILVVAAAQVVIVQTTHLRLLFLRLNNQAVALLQSLLLPQHLGQLIP